MCAIKIPAKGIFHVDSDLHIEPVFLKDLWLPDIGRIVIFDYDKPNISKFGDICPVYSCQVFRSVISVLP